MKKNHKPIRRSQHISPEVAALSPNRPVQIEEIDLDKPDTAEPSLSGAYLVTPAMTLDQAKALIKEQGFLYNSLPIYFKTAEMLEIANEWWIKHVGNRLAENGQLPQQNCLRCHHQWVPRKMDIRFCPKCHSGYWDRPFPEKKKKVKMVKQNKSLLP